MTDSVKNLSPTQGVWDVETGPAQGSNATLSQVMQAVDDPGFRSALRGNHRLNNAVASLRDGATIPELQEFDSAVHAAPGALGAFESALARVAPALVHEQGVTPGGSGAAGDAGGAQTQQPSLPDMAATGKPGT